MLAGFIFLVSYSTSIGQLVPPYGGPLHTTVQGSVGQYYLSVSGYASPNASVSLLIDGVVVRSGVADANGNFSISQVLIKLGLSNFCIESSDIAHLGTSNTCITITPANGSLDIKNIFLPPTLALSKSEIAIGETTTAYGYTMPGADVTLFLSNGTKLTGKADSKGYFSFVLKDLKEGKYTIYASAKYSGIDSLSPTKKLTVNVISKSSETVKKTVGQIEDFWSKLWKLFTSWGLGILWLIIPIIILIIILIFKLWGDKFSSIFKFKIPFGLPHIGISFPFALGRKHKLHHYWFIGY